MPKLQKLLATISSSCLHYKVINPNKSYASAYLPFSYYHYSNNNNDNANNKSSNSCSNINADFVVVPESYIFI